jgi:DNA invertase Pin-like site-specific DNA recombinase
MRQEQGNRAVIYIRVSTEEQAEDALNLVNQEKKCQSYCHQKGLTIVEKFVDAGESGRTNNRPEFQRMLSYCKVQRNNIHYVVVQDLSRFARNNRDQADAIFQLGLSGVALRSTYESSIDETAAGKLTANIFGGFNQFFSDAHSEKQRDRKRLAIAGGRVPFHAPIGYLNISAKQGPNIIPDEERAPLIRRAFELMATGLHKKRSALKTVTEEGLTTTKGKPVSAQTFDKVMRNPLYAGWVTLPSDPSVEPARGLHEPLVSQETFDRVQAILDGKKPPVAPRLKSNPEFPLRRLVRCERCGTPLTGAVCTGRNNAHYPRYWCRTKGCRAVSAPKAHLESEFQAFLGQLRTDPEKVGDFPKIAARIWEAKRGSSEQLSKKFTSQLEEQKRFKANLLTMRMNGEVTREEFEEANAAFRSKIFDLEQKLQELASTRITAESFVRFAELQLTDMAHVWRIASPVQRERVQNLLFENGLEYSSESGFLNRSKSSLFKALQEIDLQKATLVEAAGVGWTPLFQTT